MMVEIHPGDLGEYTGKSKSTIQVRRVELPGRVQAVELTIAFPEVALTDKAGALNGAVYKKVTRMWFDPARGYALLGRWTSAGDGVTTAYQTVIDDIAEAAPGVYYPRRAHGSSYFRGGAATRSTFVASRVSANAEIPEERFRLEAPATATQKALPAADPAGVP
jgi:hypothetical protein